MPNTDETDLTQPTQLCVYFKLVGSLHSNYPTHMESLYLNNHISVDLKSLHLLVTILTIPC